MWGQAKSSRQQLSFLAYDDLKLQLKGTFNRPSVFTNDNDLLLSV